MDLAQVEKDEVTVLTKYLPKQLTKDEMLMLITDTVIRQFPNATKRDMGKIIGVLKSKAGDTLDMKFVSTNLKNRLK